jgi:hypothetical protein
MGCIGQEEGQIGVDGDGTVWVVGGGGVLLYSKLSFQ